MTKYPYCYKCEFFERVGSRYPPEYPNNMICVYYCNKYKKYMDGYGSLRQLDVKWCEINKEKSKDE